MTRPHRAARAPSPEPLTPLTVMNAPELAALVLLEQAIEVARIAVLAQHHDLLDPDAPYAREPQPGAHLTKSFFTRAHALHVVVRRYRAALAVAAVPLDLPADVF